MHFFLGLPRGVQVVPTCMIMSKAQQEMVSVSSLLNTSPLRNFYVLFVFAFLVGWLVDWGWEGEGTQTYASMFKTVQRFLFIS